VTLNPLLTANVERDYCQQQTICTGLPKISIDGKFNKQYTSNTAYRYEMCTFVFHYIQAIPIMFQNGSYRGIWENTPSHVSVRFKLVVHPTDAN